MCVMSGQEHVHLAQQVDVSHLDFLPLQAAALW